MSDQQAGEATPLPVIRKTFLVNWKDADRESVYYNIIGSAINEHGRFLAIVNEDQEEYVIPLEHVTVVHSYHSTEDE